MSTADFIIWSDGTVWKPPEEPERIWVFWREGARLKDDGTRELSQDKR